MTHEMAEWQSWTSCGSADWLTWRVVVRAAMVAAILAIVFLGIARAQRSIAGADYVVCKPVVDMNAAPDAASEVVSQVIYGTGVSSLQYRGEWIRIRTADGYEGWSQASGLKAGKRQAYAPEGKAVLVAGLGVNVYLDPDVTHHAPVLQLPWEARLEIAPGAEQESARWMRVRLVDGQLAWVQKGDVTLPAPPISIEEMIRLAHRFLGITYTWGGVSSFGFDCSGFTQMLMRQRGIQMPRDADVQAEWSGVIAVERKDLKAGDLLFFGSSVNHITHTGMFLGNGEFIHDSTHDHPGVQIGKLDDAPWSKLFVAARRAKE